MLEEFPKIPYQKGDFIGQKYEVYDVLGIGGFGVVYLVYSHETGDVYALKTFRDEYLEDAQTQERFRKEANVWVDLERHPYVVRAHFVEEISGRLYIALEFILSNEGGLNTLDDYLRRKPPDLAQILRWAVQFCYGMEHAYSKGLRCHRDIKPANILITQDKRVKITDFGLAGVLDLSKVVRGTQLSVREGRVGLSGQTLEGAGIGTPTHMPLEQFTDAAGCDERSDIYSFGIVLYQMVSGNKLPFLAPWHSPEERMLFGERMYRLHLEARVPRVNSPLFRVVKRCLKKEPDQRYQTFEELRQDIESLLKRKTGEVIESPELRELEAWELNNKGVNLNNLRRFDEALQCFDKAFKIKPAYAQLGKSWSNKAMALDGLRHFKEAALCYDKALELEPRNASIWTNKGLNLCDSGQLEDAIYYFEKAIQLDPSDAKAWNMKGLCLQNHFHHFNEALCCFDSSLELDSHSAEAWNNKGNCLDHLRRFDEAISCFDKALELKPLDASAWSNKGCTLQELGLFEDAVYCFEKSLEINPRFIKAWNNKGTTLCKLGRFDEAVICYDKVLKLDPKHSGAWYSKGACLRNLGHFEEAIMCCDEAIKLNPLETNAWINKGNCLTQLERFDDAIRCFDKALELEPREARAWLGKALPEMELGHKQIAINSIKKFLALASDWPSERIAAVRQWLGELEEE